MKLLVHTLVILLLLLTNSHAESPLWRHPSPYLAMHAADPVQWRLWGEGVFAEARRENRLLYISSGYLTCNGCLRMHEESYQNPEVAALLNQFIPVKLDRELTPMVDDILQHFIERINGSQPGWPLNIFLTPEGYPLAGFTYLPPDHFRQVTSRLLTRWQLEAEHLQTLARTASSFIYPIMETCEEPLTPALAQTYQADFLSQILSSADMKFGGFGEDIKYAHVPQLFQLMTLIKQQPSEQLIQFLQLTLENLAQTGMHDTVNGGFFHAATRNWQQPAVFEKTLYSNALLIQLYFNAAVLLDEPRYADIAEQTLDFVLRDLRGTAGGFIASLSVDGDSQIRDTKQMSGWNGLLLSAITYALRYKERPDWQQHGQQLRDYLMQQAWQDGKLWRVWHEGHALQHGILEDYAYVAQGLYDWSLITQADDERHQAEVLTDTAWQIFYRNNQWYTTDEALLPMAQGSNLIIDEHKPSPAAILLALRLRNIDHHHTRLTDKEMAALSLGQEEVMQMPILHATHIGVVQLAIDLFYSAQSSSLSYRILPLMHHNSCCS